VGCSEAPSPAAQSENLRAAEPTENWAHDIQNTDLAVDIASRTATARIRFAPADTAGASFEAEGLDIHAVRGPDGVALPFRIVDGRLDVGVMAEEPIVDIEIDYGFEVRQDLEGLHTSGVTFVWPYFCGNLFPCKSDPSDGSTFGLELTGIQQGVAVYPKTIPADAPSYMIAWAIGDYTHVPLGQTDAGTTISVYHLPGERDDATQGVEHLVGVFDWLEKTYGAYSFGSDVASVSAKWGPGAYGGMEHHPYWHISSDSMSDQTTHAHEAAHGWFGDGVRIACWEDLVLSEGTVSYLTARSIEAVAGQEAGRKVWDGYESRLDRVIDNQDRIAWPDSCGEVDVLTELWNSVPYMKGAFFYRAVEEAVGREAIDRAIARFYQAHVGKAAGMQDMLDTILAETTFDASDLADAWLRSMGRPDR